MIPIGRALAERIRTYTVSRGERDAINRELRAIDVPVASNEQAAPNDGTALARLAAGRLAFALLATRLAGAGLYGVLAYTVAQPTREIVVGMAFGASGARVSGLILRQVRWMTAIGGTMGVVAASGLEGHDPLLFALAVVLLAAIARTAGLVPARRAAGIDPMQAVRHD